MPANTMAVRLNGWQRLWIVLSVLYILPVGGLVIRAWPTPALIGHRDEFIDQMPEELSARVWAVYRMRRDWEEVWKRPDSQFNRDDLSLIPFGFTPDRPSGFAWLSEPVIFPNGAVLEIQVAKKGDTHYDTRTADAYWSVVESTVRADQWFLALIWLVPCLALYALGWVVAWIRRGFRNT